MIAAHEIINLNKTIVNTFFVALETQNFELLREVFAEDGRPINPKVPAGCSQALRGGGYLPSVQFAFRKL